MSNVTILGPNEKNPPALMHGGWGNTKRKISTAGEAKTEMARLYRRTAQGLMHPDDMKAAIWALMQIAAVSEKADLEAQIAELERIVAEALGYGR